ncbi:SAM-dependent methyltransferase [Gordonia sp. NPDC003424]
MTDATEVFWRTHDGLPREAPGSAATTELLLRLVGELPERPRVIDVGCGPGPATILLAQLTGGHVTGVDLHEPFLAEVLRKAGDAGVADRVDVSAVSMTALPFAAGSVDLLWSEGSAYIMGFDAALAAWRPLLSPGGALVVTEVEWLTSTPSPAAREFWAAGYPAMRTTADNVAAAQRAGWDVRAVYVLPDSDWDAYYGPLAERVDELRGDGIPVDLLAEAVAEIDLRATHGDEYGYTGYVLRPHR